MTITLALLCGLVIGLVLGGLGGGGSVLAVPALVYVLGESPRDATTTSLVVVGVSAATSLISHQLDRTIRWGTGLAFAVVGIAFAYVGTLANASASETVLLTCFATLLLVSAAAMLVRGIRDRNRAGSSSSSSVSPAAPTPEPTPSGATTAADGGPFRSAARWLAHISWRRALLVLVSGASVGFLTGFLGVGGGFIAVPAPVMALGMPMAVAAGTSLLVITLNSATAFAIRLESGVELDLQIVLPFTAMAILASFAGHRLARRLSGHVLTMAFAGVLVVVAGAVGINVMVAAA